MTDIASPLTGEVVALDDVADDVFAERVMGDGVAILPADGAARAPVSGTVEKLFPGGHGVAIETPSGLQVLVHLGIDTVALKGEGFTSHVEEGDTVEQGDPLVSVDLDRLRALDVDTTTPLVVISGQATTVLASGQVSTGEPLLRVSE